MLTISPSPTHPSAANRFECRTCPYECILDKPYYEKKLFTRKQASDIISTEDSLKNAEKVEVTCKNEKCSNREAAVQQVQIRSADEPMTSFFTCTSCGQKWREN